MLGLFRVFLNQSARHFGDLPFVGNLFEALRRDHVVRRFSAAEHFCQNVFAHLARDGAFLDQLDQLAQIFRPDRALGNLLPGLVQQVGELRQHPIGRRFSGRAGSDHAFVIVGQGAGCDQQTCVVGGQLVFPHETVFFGLRQLRCLGAKLGFPFLGDGQPQQVRFGEIAVVVGELLAAHAEGALSAAVPQARLLHDLFAFFDQFDLPLDFVVERLLEEAEGVEILHLGLDAEPVGGDRPNADVRVAAQRTFFHVATGDFQVLKDSFQLRQVVIGFLGGAQVRFADDFNQRHAAPVQVDIAFPVRIGEAFVQRLAGVFFHVEPRDADALTLRRAVRPGFDFHPSVLG